MSGSVSRFVGGLGRVWLSLGLVVSLTAALLVGLPSPAGAVAGPYSDVSVTHDHVDSITRLKDLGVFDGIELAFCEDGNFCPDTPIDRKTFSVWLIRILDGDDAPDFVGAGGGLDFDFGAVLADPGLYGLLGPEVIDWLTPRFEDVSRIHPFHNFVERLAELGIAGGCSQEPAKFCPDDAIRRNQMAAFFVRAFDLAEANKTRFVDVESDSPHHENINRLVATTIDPSCRSSRLCPGQATTNDPGCGYPSRFCPGDTISRAQMASLLTRAIDWQEARAEVETNGSDDSIGLGVTYDEEEYEATVSWSAPTASNGQVKHYVLQSRLILEDFGPKFYHIVETESNQTSYQATVPTTNSNYLYAFRVIVVYENGKKLATTEVKTPSNAHKLRDVIKEKVVEAKQDQQPWLTDVWLHMNDRSRFGISLGAGSVGLRSEYPYPNGLKRTFVSGLSIGPSTFKNPTGNYALIHEMGHVYTLTNDISEDSAPIGVAHLYLHLLRTEHAAEARDPARCLSDELYADLAVMAFFDQYSYFDPQRGLNHGLANGINMPYWVSCGFRLDQSTNSAVATEMPAITKSVFVDQEIPQWFYDTYQKTDGSIDLEKLWSDINISAGSTATIKPIAYHLRNKFGGYCSEEQVRQFIEGKATGITNPWKDGGCDDNVVVEEEDTSSSTSSTVIPNAPDISSLIENAAYGSYPLVFLQKLRNKPDRCWIAINNYVYDVTPGDEGYNYPGPGQITDLCGQDASDHFSSNNLGYPPIKHLKGYLRSR